MIRWDEDGRTIQETRHDWHDDDISDELFDYWDWAEEREAWKLAMLMQMDASVKFEQ